MTQKLAQLPPLANIDFIDTVLCDVMSYNYEDKVCRLAWHFLQAGILDRGLDAGESIIQIHAFLCNSPHFKMFDDQERRDVVFGTLYYINEISGRALTSPRRLSGPQKYFPY